MIIEISGLITNTLRCGIVSRLPGLATVRYRAWVRGSVLRWWIAFPQGLDFHHMVSMDLSRHSYVIRDLHVPNTSWTQFIYEMFALANYQRASIFQLNGEAFITNEAKRTGLGRNSDA